MESKQNRLIKGAKKYSKLSITKLSKPVKKDASVEELKQDWESLRFGLSEDECNKTNYAEWIENAKSKEYDLKKFYLNEMKPMKKPTPAAYGIVSIAYYILKKKNKPYNKKLWDAFFKDVSGTVQDINSFDYSKLSYKNCVTLKSKLEAEKEENMKSCSVGAAKMFDWATTMAKLRIVSGIYEEQ